MNDPQIINDILSSYLARSNATWDGQRFLVNETVKTYLGLDVGQSGWNADMSDELLENYDSNDDQRPLSVASRNNANRQVLSKTSPPRPTILEIGCGHGLFLKSLKQDMPEAIIMGADYSPELLETAAKTALGVPLFQMDITDCKLPTACMDGVVALNVLEHVENHFAAVEQVFRILKPGGIFVIEVPAGPSLYDAFDKHFSHFRRYSMDKLVTLVEMAGFEVAFKSHLGFLVYPFFWAMKKKNRWKESKGQLDVSKTIKATFSKGSHNQSLSNIMRAEEIMGKHISYPFGIRCLLTGKKPQTPVTDNE